MKKLIVFVLAFALIFCFAACGETKTEDDNKQDPSASVSSRTMDPEDIDDDEIDCDNDIKEPLVLDGDEEFVVVGRKTDEMLTSIKDIKGKRVGSLFGSDGEKIAEYYGAVFAGFGSDGDCYSGMKTHNSANSLDYIIVREMSIEDRMTNDYKVVLDKIVIE